MRLTATMAGLFLCVLVFMTSGSKASAQAGQPLVLDTAMPTTSSSDKLAVLDLVEQRSIKQQAEVVEIVPQPAPAAAPTHAVASGESLISIAAKYQTSWQRLYSKNAQIADPNVITAGVVLTIPAADEQLPERPLPVAVSAPVQRPGRQAATRPAASRTTAKQVPRGSVAGNTYSQGYCTWYVKNRRPDLPNNLGNADTWVARAAAQGLPTGSTPRVGAVGQRAMHVVYVEAVNGNGTITISEMNREGLYVKSSRTVPANQFQYIY